MVDGILCTDANANDGNGDPNFVDQVFADEFFKV